MILPSKELLSEVLKICDCKPHKIQDTDLWFEYEADEDYGLVWTNDSINIYELAYRCKGWAIEQGFSITSTNSYMGDLQPMAQPISSNGCEYSWINGVTEPEAIFKACQWILDNKEQQ